MTVTLSEESEVERILRDLRGTDATHGRVGVLVEDLAKLCSECFDLRRDNGDSTSAQAGNTESLVLAFGLCSQLLVDPRCVLSAEGAAFWINVDRYVRSYT